MKFFLKKLFKRFWIWISRFIGSLIMILLLIGVAVASFYLVLWQIEGPNVTLRGGIVPSFVVMLGLIGLTSGILVRYMFGNQAIKRILKGSLIGFLAAAIKVASIAVICAGISVAAFNPVGNTQLHIVFDDYSSLATEYRVEWFEKAASIVKANEGRDIKFDNAEIEEIVRVAATESDVTELSSTLLKEIEKLEPLNKRLENLQGELSNRSGDAVYVLSNHREPNASVKGWPFDTTRIYSVWQNVNPIKGMEKAKRPRILMYLIYHEPTIKPLLQIELEVPSEFQPEKSSQKMELPYPNLKLKVFKKGNDNPVWKYTAKPPQREEHQKFIKPNLTDKASFGHYGDRISYQIQLPMNGHQMTIEFEDEKGIWKSETEYMPKFSGKPFSLPPRSLEVVFLGSKKQREALEKLRGLVPNKEASKAPPLRFVTMEQAKLSVKEKTKTVIQMKIGQVTAEEKNAIGKVVNHIKMAMVEVIEAEIGQNANLKRTPHYHAQPHGIAWNDPKQFPMLEYTEQIDNEKDRVVFVSVANQQQTTPILYQKEENRPGYVTIVIPKQLEKLSIVQKKAVAHLLVWAASLARRFGETEPPVTTYEFTPSKADIIMLPTEAGIKDKTSVWNEFSHALIGKLDEQVPVKSENSIDREVLIYSFWGLVVLVALTVPISLFGLWRSLKQS